MRTRNINIRIPENTWEQLDLYSFLVKESKNKILVEALEQALKKIDKSILEKMDQLKSNK